MSPLSSGGIGKTLKIASTTLSGGAFLGSAANHCPAGTQATMVKGILLNRKGRPL